MYFRLSEWQVSRVDEGEGDAITTELRRDLLESSQNGIRRLGSEKRIRLHVERCQNRREEGRLCMMMEICQESSKRVVIVYPTHIDQ